MAMALSLTGEPNVLLAWAYSEKSVLRSSMISFATVFVPVMAVTLVFGVADGVAATPWADKVPAWFGQLPLAGQSLGWLLPVAVTLVLVVALDRLLGLRQSATTA